MSTNYGTPLNSFKDIYYIGDRSYDFYAAEKLGAQFIGMGTRHKQELVDIGIDKIVDDFTNHQPILQWLNLPH